MPRSCFYLNRDNFRNNFGCFSLLGDLTLPVYLPLFLALKRSVCLWNDPAVGRENGARKVTSFRKRMQKPFMGEMEGWRELTKLILRGCT